MFVPESVETIMAIVALQGSEVSGQAPIFFTSNVQQQERLALLLSRIMMAAVHDLENGIFIIVKH